MGWAGQGPEVFHLQYPRGIEGNQTYHYVTRYRQGIQFNFESSGKIYKFDFVYLVRNGRVTATQWPRTG